MQNEINKLPAAQQSAAQQELERRKKIREEMSALTPEQRAKRWQDLMNSPDAQARMENAQNQRDSQQSADQREANAQNYLSKMASARAAASGQ